MAFGQNPTTGTQGTLPGNQFPLSSVAVPGTANGDLTALEGGPISTDTNNNKTAPASVYVKDGSDLTQGITTDAAVVGDTAGSISAKLRGMTKILNDVWDNVNHLLHINLKQVGGAAIANTNPIPAQDIEQAGYVAATTPPAITNVAADTPYTFSAQVNRVIIENNTSANVNFAFDVAASAGSLVLVPGAMLVYPKKCTVLHLFTAAAQNINGTVSGNVVVLGAL